MVVGSPLLAPHTWRTRTFHTWRKPLVWSIPSSWFPRPDGRNQLPLHPLTANRRTAQASSDANARAAWMLFSRLMIACLSALLSSSSYW